MLSNENGQGFKDRKFLPLSGNVDCSVQIFRMTDSNKTLVGSRFMDDLESGRTSGRRIACRSLGEPGNCWRKEASALDHVVLQIQPHVLLLRSTFKPRHTPTIIIVIDTRRPAIHLDATSKIRCLHMYASRAHGTLATEEFMTLTRPLQDKTPSHELDKAIRQHNSLEPVGMNAFSRVFTPRFVVKYKS